MLQCISGVEKYTNTGMKKVERSPYFRDVLIELVPLYTISCTIRESVDSLCRDGADMPRPPYIGKACTRPNLEDLSLFRYLSNVYESLCTQ